MTEFLHPPSMYLRYLLAGIAIFMFHTLNGQNDLFISEYVESPDEKCIEIFNPSNTAVSLDGVYRIRMGFNGGTLTTKSNLTGTIPPGQTHVVCTSGSSFPYDQSMGAVGHNGNDVVVLEKNMNPIDIIGNIGCDPGTAWTASGLSTQGMSLIRKGCITDGVGSDPPDSPCSFPSLSAEWIGFSPGISRLGIHGFLHGDLIINESDPAQCGGEDGAITLQANGAGLEYSINGTIGPFSTSGNFNNLSAGTYEVIVRVADDPDCYLTGQATLDEGSLPVIDDITTYNPTDCDLDDGAMLITATGINLEYSVNNGLTFQSGPLFNGLAPGNYHLSVREVLAINCLVNGTALINALSHPELNSIVPTDVSDCGADDGTIEIDATPSGLEYSIDNGTSWSASPLFSGLTDGVYPVVVRRQSATACRESDVVTISAPSPPLAQVDVITHADCRGSANGSISISVAGGSGIYQYEWSGPSPVGNVASAYDLVAGEYNVTVTDMLHPGCIDLIHQMSVEQPADDPPIPNLMPIPDLCELGPPIPLNPNQDNFTGNWTGPGVSDNQFSPEGLGGSVILRFEPAPGICAQAADLSIFVHSASTPQLQSLPNLCANEDPVMLDAIQDGIRGSWSGPGIQNNLFSPSGLNGTQNLNFRVDKDQCAHDGFQNVMVFPVRIPRLDPLPSICQGDLPLSLPRFQDQILGDWHGPGVMNNFFTAEGLSGTITLEFTPLTSQCAEPVIQSIEVGTNPILEIQGAAPSCYDSHDGHLEVTITGGKSPYRLDWDNDGTGDFDDSYLLTNLAEGSYSVQVEDQNGCLSEEVADLKEPEILRLILDVTPESQSGAGDGEIRVNVTGGNRPYYYEWSNGATGHIISDLEPGNYLITVTDDHGCEVSAMSVINPGECNINGTVIQEDVTCHGFADGVIEIRVEGTLSPSQIQWSHDQELDTNRVVDLTPGTYQVTISDGEECEVTYEITIGEPDSLVTELSVLPESAAGASDGLISASTSGGTLPYIWQWDSGDTSNVRTGLGSGQYQITTTDSRGCTHIETAVINGVNCALNLNSLTIPVSCAEFTDARIEISPENGAEPYQYEWSHDTSLNMPVASGLSAGRYMVSVIDDLGCIASDTIDLIDPAPLAVTLTVQPPTSSNLDGQIQSMASGGIEPYAWSWNTGANTPSIDQLGPGTYTLRVTDANGCHQEDSVVFSQPIDRDCTLEFAILTDSVRCAGRKNGVAEVMIISGDGPFSITWSHDSDEKAMKLDNLAAGIYSVTVTDGEFCSETQFFTIAEPEPLRLTFDAENESFVGAKDGYIVVKPFGGTPPYSFQWNTGQTQDSIGALKPGTYIATVTDSRGCMWSRSTIINAADCTLLSNVSARPASCPGEASGSARLDITTLDFPVNIQWSHDSLLTRNVAENLLAGNYNVTITDQIGCRHTWFFEISEPDSLQLDFNVTHQSEPGVNDGSAQVLIGGGTPDYAIFWSDGSTNESIDRLAPGQYKVTIVDAHGCSIQDSVEILSSDQCRLQANLKVTASGCDDASGRITLEPQNSRGKLSFTWSRSQYDTLSSISNLSPGEYWFKMQDDYCTLTDTVSIETNEIRSLSYDLRQSACDPGDNELVIGAVTGGRQPFQFLLDGEKIEKDIPITLGPGSHFLNVTDSTGCIYMETLNLSDQGIRVSRDTVIKIGATIELSAEYFGIPGSANFGWKDRSGTLCDSCFAVSVSPRQSETYTFYYVDKAGCKLEEKVRITVSEQNLFYIPNVFTPNQDGLNDGFIVYDALNLIEEIISLEIFDRRGVRIYHTGKLPANQEAPDFADVMQRAIAPQVYIYHARIKFRQGFERNVSGDFTLLR